MSHLYQNLVDELIKKNLLQTPEIIGSFRHVIRNDFVLPEYRHEAHYDFPLSIGYGQTISQPRVVAFMLELLKPEVGNKVLDIGAGSGWQTSLLAKIVGKLGRVVGVERIPQLIDFAEENIAKYNFDNVELILADGYHGFTQHEPYDRIIAAATTKNISEEMLRQLKIGGKLVIPVGDENHSLYFITRIGENDFKYRKYPGFDFVPLINNRNIHDKKQ